MVLKNKDCWIRVFLSAQKPKVTKYNDNSKTGDLPNTADTCSHERGQSNI